MSSNGLFCLECENKMEGAGVRRRLKKTKASLQRLVDAVNHYCIEPTGEIASIAAARGEFQEAFDEAKSLLKEG